MMVNSNKQFLESGVMDPSGKYIIPMKKQTIALHGNPYILVSDENFKQTVLYDLTGKFLLLSKSLLNNI
jgi:hypothetical protein